MTVNINILYNSTVYQIQLFKSIIHPFLFVVDIITDMDILNTISFSKVRIQQVIVEPLVCVFRFHCIRTFLAVIEMKM